MRAIDQRRIRLTWHLEVGFPQVLRRHQILQQSTLVCFCFFLKNEIKWFFMNVWTETLYGEETGRRGGRFFFRGGGGGSRSFVKSISET